MDEKSDFNSFEPTVKKRKISVNEDAKILDDVATDSKNNDLNIIRDFKELPKNGEETHILKSFNPTTSFANVTERYLTPYYYVDNKVPGNDTCVWVHSNRICLISLAPSHEIINEKKKIKCINFKVSDKLDRASNKVSGKSKHGAQPLQPSSTICSIECEDDKIYFVKCNMTGKLMEINDALLTKPELLLQPPHRGGYLAIALPNILRFETLTTELLNQELYDAKFAAKKTVIS